MHALTGISLKRVLAVLCALPGFLFAAGGGSEEQAADYNITLNGHAIVWAGYADADPSLKKNVDATTACLRANSLVTRPGYPLVIVVDGTFNCNGILARGCAQIGGTSVYVTEDYLYTTVFTHEVVHWETGMGNEYHNTPQFTVCSTVLEA